MPSQLLPNLIIAGVIKGATTSLFTYLSHHPSICFSTIKETNYFLPLLLDRNLQPIEEYANNFTHCNKYKHTKKYVMEATPSYIYGGEKLARAVYECLGPIRIVFVFRNPITRLQSHYMHYKRTKKSDKRLANVSLEEYVGTALKEFRGMETRKKEKCINIYKENIFIGGIAGGLYADCLMKWYSIFGSSIKVCFFEHLITDPLSVICDLCNWLGIDSTIYSSYEFNIENRGIEPRIRFLHKLGGAINTKFEAFFRRHESTKRSLRDIYCFLNERTGKEESLTDHTYKQLESLYTPYNNRLSEILESKGYSNFPNWLKE